jgi:hypothetical protein
VRTDLVVGSGGSMARPTTPPGSSTMQKHGARTFLWPRLTMQSIKAFTEMLRLITDGSVSRSGARLSRRAQAGLQPNRPLKGSKRPINRELRRSAAAATVEVRGNPLANGIRNVKSEARNAPTSGDWPKFPDGKPDFSKMSSAERRAYDQARLTRRFG